MTTSRKDETINLTISVCLNRRGASVIVEKPNDSDNRWRMSANVPGMTGVAAMSLGALGQWIDRLWTAYRSATPCQRLGFHDGERDSEGNCDVCKRWADVEPSPWDE